MPETFKLSKPIISSKGELREITLRDPSAGDLKKLGIFFEDGNIVWGRLIDWIARLSGLETPAIESMHPRDLGMPTKWISDELMWDVPEKNSD